MKKAALMLCMLALVCAGLATAEEAPAPIDGALDAHVAVEAQETAKAQAEEPAAQCQAKDAGDKLFAVDTQSKSHCSDPWTCTYQEPGLGFGCTCTYRCQCVNCNGQVGQLNCVLIDDGGCFACPSYN